MKKRVKKTPKKKVRKVHKKPAKKTNKKLVKKNQKNTIKSTKDRKIKRIATGVPAFDKLIEGGFEERSTNLIVGGPGSGKTILATQFLIDGIKNDEKCLYVTFEEKKEQFFKNMNKFGWDLEKKEKENKFFFLEYTPIKVKTMLEEGGGEIETIVLKEKINRMIIDSITSFSLLFDNELEKREAALNLFNMLKRWNCTTVLTYEGDPTADSQPDSRTLEFESDSIIFLHFIRSKRKRERYLEVLKMRGTKHAKELYSFSIGKGGITLSPRPTTGVVIK